MPNSQMDQAIREVVGDDDFEYGRVWEELTEFVEGKRQIIDLSIESVHVMECDHGLMRKMLVAHAKSKPIVAMLAQEGVEEGKEGV